MARTRIKTWLRGMFPRYRRLHCLVHDGLPAPRRLPSGVIVRPIEAAELMSLAKNPINDMKESFAEDFARSGDLCLGAFVGGSLASYSFFGRGMTPIDECLEAQYIDKYIYLYKAYTLPENRGRGLSSLVTSRLGFAEGWAGGASAVFCFVDAGNEPSFKAFAKQGFRPGGAFHIAYTAWGAWATPQGELKTMPITLRSCKQR